MEPHSLIEEDLSSPVGGRGEAGTGEWSCVTSKKTKGKKKKMKNARTLSLQTFFSESGNRGGSPGSDLSVGGQVAEDVLARESLLSYFLELVLRLGPLKLDGPQLKSHIEECLTDSSFLGSHTILDQDNLHNFLSLSPELMLVDDYVCSRRQSSQAKQLALNLVLESFNIISSSSVNSRGEVTATGNTNSSAIGSSSGNAWKTGPPKSIPSSSSAGRWAVDPLLQLPKVESLFNGTGSKPFAIPLPDLSSPPPPLTSVPPPPLPPVAEAAFSSMEQMTKRLKGLAVCNSDLLKQLAEKERQLQQLQSKVQNQERMLEISKLEVARLQKLSLPVTDVTVDTDSESQVVGTLKKQLESERWNSGNLKEQLDLERVYANRMTEKHNFLLNRLQNLTERSTSSLDITDVSKQSLTNGDPFGLRRLLANATLSSSENSLFSPSSGPAAGGGLADGDLFGRMSKF